MKFLKKFVQNIYIFGIDLDNAIDKDGNPTKEAADILSLMKIVFAVILSTNIDAEHKTNSRRFVKIFGFYCSLKIDPLCTAI